MKNKEIKDVLTKFLSGVRLFIQESGYVAPLGNDGLYPSDERFTVTSDGKYIFNPRLMEYGHLSDMVESHYSEHVFYAMHNIYTILLQVLDKKVSISKALFDRFSLEFSYLPQIVSLNPDLRFNLWVVDDRTEQLAKLYKEFFSEVEKLNDPLGFLPGIVTSVLLPLALRYAGVDPKLFNEFNLEKIFTAFNVVSFDEQIEFYHFSKNVLANFNTNSYFEQRFITDIKLWRVLRGYEKQFDHIFHLDKESYELRYRLLNLLLKEKKAQTLQMQELENENNSDEHTQMLVNDILQDEKTNSPICSIDGVNLTIRDYLTVLVKIAKGQKVSVSAENSQEYDYIFATMQSQLNNNAPGILGKAAKVKSFAEKNQMVRDDVSQRRKKLSINSEGYRKLKSIDSAILAIEGMLAENKVKLAALKKKKLSYAVAQKMPRVSPKRKGRIDALKDNIDKAEKEIFNLLSQQVAEIDTSLRSDFAQKQTDALNKYLLERRKKYILLDFFQKIFSFLLKQTHKAVREHFVAKLCAELNNYINTGDKTKLVSIYEEGITTFKPRRKSEDSLKALLVKSKALLNVSEGVTAAL